MCRSEDGNLRVKMMSAMVVEWLGDGCEAARCVGMDFLEGIMGLASCVLVSIASTFHRQKKA